MGNKSKKKPFITVCVPVYNGSKVLYESLNTILNFDYSQYNVVVIDNASTDDILRVVNKVKNDNICNINVEVVRYESKVEAELNFNRCIKHVKGEYFAVYHSDDLYDKEILEKESDFLSNNIECACTLTLSRHIDNEAKLIRKQFVPNELNKLDTILIDRVCAINLVLKYGNIFHCPSAMFRTSDYIEQGYNWDYQSYNKSADLGLWMKITERKKIGVILEFLTSYRLGVNSFSYNDMRVKTYSSPMLKVINDTVTKSRVKNQKLLKYVDVLDLKDKVDIHLNRANLNIESSQNLPSLYSILGLMMNKNIFFSKYHMKIVIWSLVVVSFVRPHTPVFILNFLLNARHGKISAL